MTEYIEREAFLKDIEERYCLPCKEAGKDHNGCKCDVCWVEDLYGETLRRWCAAKTASIGRTITMAIRTRNADGGHGETPDASDFCSYGEQKDGDSDAKAD